VLHTSVALSHEGRGFYSQWRGKLIGTRVNKFLWLFLESSPRYTGVTRTTLTKLFLLPMSIMTFIQVHCHLYRRLLPVSHNPSYSGQLPENLFLYDIFYCHILMQTLVYLVVSTFQIIRPNTWIYLSSFVSCLVRDHLFWLLRLRKELNYCIVS
jgi:hypothetical protein